MIPVMLESGTLIMGLSLPWSITLGELLNHTPVAHHITQSESIFLGYFWSLKDSENQPSQCCGSLPGGITSGWKMSSKCNLICGSHRIHLFSYCVDKPPDKGHLRREELVYFG